MTQQDFVGYTDSDLIYLIAEKTAKEITENDSTFVQDIGGWITMAVCLEAVHEINPLRLEEMLDGRAMDRAHDVLGCLNYYDWASNELTECFSPRYTK